MAILQLYVILDYMWKEFFDSKVLRDIFSHQETEDKQTGNFFQLQSQSFY